MHPVGELCAPFGVRSERFQLVRGQPLFEQLNRTRSVEADVVAEAIAELVHRIERAPAGSQCRRPAWVPT
jgi:hypothetical protein